MNTSSHESKHQEHGVHIEIDDVKYVLPSGKVTGAVIRALVPVASNLDLWLEVHGAKDDVLVRPEAEFEVKPGSKFYTAPSTINPGDK